MSEETTDKFANWPLTKMTAQEVFDTVKRHLLKQGIAAKDGEMSCVYRAPQPEGPPLMCAAGCLIPDAAYNADKMDHGRGSGWGNLVKEGLVPDTHKMLIMSLQELHDGWAPCRWEERLKNFAEIWKLNYDTEAKDNSTSSND